jgi:anthranilate phosphoribosyltransferase
MLGPLTNPAEPPYQVDRCIQRRDGGIDGRARWRACPGSNVPSSCTGANGWDEPTPIGPFSLFDVRDGAVVRSERTPEEYGLARCTPQALAGGDAGENAAALRAVLRGEDRGAHRDALCLGVSLALECTGLASNSPRDGLVRAAAAIDTGAARTTLESSARFGAGARA